jgi:hypothetical protein
MTLPYHAFRHPLYLIIGIAIAVFVNIALSLINRLRGKR